MAAKPPSRRDLATAAARPGRSPPVDASSDDDDEVTTPYGRAPVSSSDDDDTPPPPAAKKTKEKKKKKEYDFGSELESSDDEAQPAAAAAASSSTKRSKPATKKPPSSPMPLRPLVSATTEELARLSEKERAALDNAHAMPAVFGTGVAHGDVVAQQSDQVVLYHRITSLEPEAAVVLSMVKRSEKKPLSATNARPNWEQVRGKADMITCLRTRVKTPVVGDTSKWRADTPGTFETATNWVRVERNPQAGIHSDGTLVRITPIGARIIRDKIVAERLRDENGGKDTWQDEVGRRKQLEARKKKFMATAQKRKNVAVDDMRDGRFETLVPVSIFTEKEGAAGDDNDDTLSVTTTGTAAARKRKASAAPEPQPKSFFASLMGAAFDRFVNEILDPLFRADPNGPSRALARWRLHFARWVEQIDQAGLDAHDATQLDLFGVNISVSMEQYRRQTAVDTGDAGAKKQKVTHGEAALYCFSRLHALTPAGAEQPDQLDRVYRREEAEEATAGGDNAAEFGF
jgi:hypothetical protein